METKKIICFGFGQVAKNFVKKLNDQGVPLKLTTTSREETRNKKFENVSYESFQFTEEVFETSNNMETEETSNGLENFGIEEETPELFNSEEKTDTFDEISSLDVREETSEEDDLEIPAFLRRQKN